MLFFSKRLRGLDTTDKLICWQTKMHQQMQVLKHLSQGLYVNMRKRDHIPMYTLSSAEQHLAVNQRTIDCYRMLAFPIPLKPF